VSIRESNSVIGSSDAFIKASVLNYSALLAGYPAANYLIGDLSKVIFGENEFTSSKVIFWTAPKYEKPPGLYIVKNDIDVDPVNNYWGFWEEQSVNSLKTVIFDVTTDWAAFFAVSPTLEIGSFINYLGVRYISLTGVVTAVTPDLDNTNFGCYVDLVGKLTTPYKEGRFSYDPVLKNHMLHTGYTDVVVDAGRETQGEFFNITGTLIKNGDPVSVTVTFSTVIVLGVPKVLPDIYPTDSSTGLNALAFAGIATMDIPPGEPGIVTSYGLVKGMNTQSLIQGFIYADSDGWYTQIRPLYPEQRILVGAVTKTGVSDGEIFINYQRLVRADLGKGYAFTSRGIGEGLYYKGGFYDWAATSITLNQGSLTQIFGDSGRAYAAHVGIVPDGPGVVDAGQVGLKVTGIEDSETGIQVAAQTGVITEDITTLTADVMAETFKKFSGQVTFELYIVSGSPVNYSLTFNYGYSKYDDLGNKDFTLTGLECVWQGNALDASFDIALKHHKPEGWTYSASGFVPGNGDIARKSVDQVLAGDVNDNEDGSWKRVLLDTFIHGDASEGIIFEIITSQNNTIQTMDMHIDAVSEEL
jgi:hypothetical protein